MVVMFVMVISLFSCSTVAVGAIKMKPYLQAVTSNSIYVLVECDSTSQVTVDYGPTTSYTMSATTVSTAATTASPVTYVHRVKLTGLQPNQTYHYQATQGSSSYPDSTFTTLVNPGSGFRFAYMADCRSGTAIHDAISTRILNANPLFSLYGGDLCVSTIYADLQGRVLPRKRVEPQRQDTVLQLARQPRAVGAKYQGVYLGTRPYTGLLFV